MKQVIVGVKSGPPGPPGPPDTNDLNATLAFGNSAGNQKITNLTDPTAAQDAATKAYVDAHDTAGSETLAQVLTNGNEVGTGPTSAITAPKGGLGVDGGPVELFAGSGNGAGGPSSTGPDIYLAGGHGDGTGGDLTIQTGGAGTGSGMPGGSFTLVATDGDGAGGAFHWNTGNAGAGSGANGGDILIQTGAGDGAGRNGLIFLNLPTADPGVSGALWVDPVTHLVHVSP